MKRLKRQKLPASDSTLVGESCNVRRDPTSTAGISAHKSRVFVKLVTKAELQESAADMIGMAVKTAVSLVTELPA